jgi:spermidine synthase
MIGLALGAFLSSKRKMARFSQLVLLQFGFLMLVLAMRISLDARPAESVLFAFLFLLGYLGGDFFIVFNSLFFKEKAQTGLGYGWDLLGSFLAAVGLSAVLIPLAGLQVLFQYLFLMNSFGLLFLVVRRNNPPSPLL